MYETITSNARCDNTVKPKYKTQLQYEVSETQYKLGRMNTSKNQ